MSSPWEERPRYSPISASGESPGLDHDELVRPHTTFESLAALPPAFAALGADGQDAIALGAYPGVASIEHLHTVGTRNAPKWECA